MTSQFTEPILSPMTSQLVSETKVITLTKHMLKCDTFLTVNLSSVHNGAFYAVFRLVPLVVKYSFACLKRNSLMLKIFSVNVA